MTTTDSNAKRMAIHGRDVPQSRSRLAEAMGAHIGFVLHRDAQDTWIVAIAKDSQLMLVKDAPARKFPNARVFDSMNKEQLESFAIPLEALDGFLDVVAEITGMRIAPKGSRGGRRPQYTFEDAKRIFEHKRQGASIREIAKKENMSPTTVQRLLKKHTPEIILDSMASIKS